MVGNIPEYTFVLDEIRATQKHRQVYPTPEAIHKDVRGYLAEKGFQVDGSNEGPLTLDRPLLVRDLDIMEIKLGVPLSVE